ncbi:helix-turn-helix transcriptional regulator [Streptomyces sp. NPDC050610]|uniref:helix-turn-helix transcriptional regulator n=1 Tax=Streptomyces sp. NPDC050610 TaxID=3157097 RepID=UPI00341F9C41
MSSELADNVRNHRRRAGFSQERLAEAADVSPALVRKVEQGGTPRVETLYALARALGVTTSALFATGAPEPVRDDGPNHLRLMEIRRALMPPVGLREATAGAGEPPPPPTQVIRRNIADVHALYQTDRYDSVAKQLPGIVGTAESAVTAADGDEEHRQALSVRAQAFLLAGKYLTQVRQYDLAYYALSQAIRDARAAGETLTAATGVVGLSWLLLRQDRFDECESLAAATADEMEPRVSTAAPGQIAVWGELSLRVASAAIRNNRPDAAREARRMASTAASALGVEHLDFGSHWTTFGPVTAEMKAVEDLSLVGDAHGVLRRSDDGVLSRRGVKAAGKPSSNNWDRHRLDVARAHVTLGSHQDAMHELNSLRRTSPEWVRHQAMARYVMADVLHHRKRTLTKDMRDMAAHLGITG